MTPSVIEDALQALHARLQEVDRELAPLSAERNELQTAIEKLEAVVVPRPARARGSARVPAQGRTATTNGGRAPRGENRRRILQTIAHESKTATEIAKLTNITVGTVSTTLTKLVKDGAATKAARGYRAA
jgi:predicted Rossmann fold nucleotide-binding protein DprA/Smf involved in DNA uptake